MTTAHDFSGAEAFAPHRSVPRPPLTIVGHNESCQSGHSLPTAEPAISFGAFHLLPAQRLLLEADKPLPVDSRALDILIALWSSVPVRWAARTSSWPASGPIPSSRKTISRSRSPRYAESWAMAGPAGGMWSMFTDEATSSSRR